MFGQPQISGFRVFLSVIVGLLLALMPLADWLKPLRPDFLLLFVIYWSLMGPRFAGLLFAWLCGLCVDVLQGMVLGEHALAFLLVSYLTHRFQLRLRIFPIWQQAGAVLAFLAIYHFAIFWIDGLTGHPVTSFTSWLPIFTGALTWPLLVAAFDTWMRPRR
jgi:rod shape-determining protein MreD